jgi:hypothetical protein
MSRTCAGIEDANRIGATTESRSRTVTLSADRATMRALLEFLGIIQPSRARREPVALPAWFRLVLLVLVPALAVASTAIYVIVRALLS